MNVPIRPGAGEGIMHRTEPFPRPFLRKRRGTRAVIFKTPS